MAITNDEILKALREKHNGILRFVNKNLIEKLARSLSKATVNQYYQQVIDDMLAELADRDKVVIEKTDSGWYTLIALPEALEAERQQAEGDDQTVPAPDGQNKTTYARDSRGKDLASTLPKNSVSEVTVTPGDDAAVAEFNETARELVIENLKAHKKTKFAETELLATISAILTELGFGSDIQTVGGLPRKVLAHMERMKDFKEVTKLGGPRLLELVLSKPTNREVIASLLKDLRKTEGDLEAAQAENTRLQARVAELEARPAPKSAISPDKLKELLNQLSEAERQNEQLNEQVERLTRAGEELGRDLNNTKEERDAFQKLNKEAQTKADGLQEQLTTKLQELQRSEAKVIRLQTELHRLKQEETAELDDATLAELRKRGIID